MGHLVFERFSNPNMPSYHPIPWISGVNPPACNSSQKAPGSHPSGTTQELRRVHCLPWMVALQKPQFLKAIAPSLRTKTKNPLQTGCP